MHTETVARVRRWAGSSASSGFVRAGKIWEIGDEAPDFILDFSGSPVVGWGRTSTHLDRHLSDLSSGLEVQALSRGEMESNERVAAIVTSTVLVPAPGSRRSSRTQPLAVSRQPNARSSNPVNNLLTMSTISQREWITDRDSVGFDSGSVAPR